MSKEYDTLVSVAVQNDPLLFVDELNKAAETADMSTAPLLREAACVIASLILDDKPWHHTARERNHHGK